jgi:hypothetical protein
MSRIAVHRIAVALAAVSRLDMSWNDGPPSTAPVSRLDMGRNDLPWSAPPDTDARCVDRDAVREPHAKGEPRERPVRPIDPTRAAESALRA